MEFAQHARFQNGQQIFSLSRGSVTGSLMVLHRRFTHGISSRQPGAAAAAQPQMAAPAVPAATAVAEAAYEGGDVGAEGATNREHGVAEAPRDGETGGVAAGSTMQASSASSSSVLAPAASVENEGSLERILEVLNELVRRVGALEVAVAGLRPS